MARLDGEFGIGLELAEVLGSVCIQRGYNGSGSDWVWEAYGFGGRTSQM